MIPARSSHSALFLMMGPCLTVVTAFVSPIDYPTLSQTRLPMVHPDFEVSSLDISSFKEIHLALSSAGNVVLEAFQSEDRPFQYAFMLPTMTIIATCCQLAGIGGAALLSPLFLLIFPLLGPDYPLATASSAIASALLTEVFGFSSGLSGYSRRGLVDWTVASQYLVLSMPFALLGALLASTVASNPTLLRGVYAFLMIGLSAYLTFSESPEELSEEECEVLDAEGTARVKTAADGTVYRYLKPVGTATNAAATGSGAVLTGLLGVGIGEVVLPQLIRGGCMPLPVAAGTSVAVVVMTALTAAVVQFVNLAAQVTGDSSTGLFEGLVQVMPWSLVQFTIPGALVGGQIAPYIAAQKILDDEEIERFASVLFGIIGIAFAIKCVTG